MGFLVLNLLFSVPGDVESRWGRAALQVFFVTFLLILNWFDL